MVNIGARGAPIAFWAPHMGRTHSHTVTGADMFAVPRVAAAAGSLSVSVSRAWEANVAVHGGEGASFLLVRVALSHLNSNFWSLTRSHFVRIVFEFRMVHTLRLNDLRRYNPQQ